MQKQIEFNFESLTHTHTLPSRSIHMLSWDYLSLYHIQMYKLLISSDMSFYSI